MDNKKYSKSIFIFRRDLRLFDNVGLLHAIKNSESVLPIFIFTPVQLDNNPFKSDFCVRFMIESLEDLDKQLKKYGSRIRYFYGDSDKVVKNLINKYGPDAIFTNQDYTPFSKKRDEKIKKICEENDVQFEAYEDILLNPVGSIKTGGNEIYTKFTPYFTKAKKVRVPNIYKSKFTKHNFVSAKTKIDIKEYKKDIHSFYDDKDLKYHLEKGGRSIGIKMLAKASDFKNYNKQRDNLNYSTTHLSAYLKFGCVSVREVYRAFNTKLGKNNDLIKQLYWRDFYYNICDENPQIFTKNPSLKEKYNKIKWSNNHKDFDLWKDGSTGFPVVDACMREMNNTGYMHNRGRLITSNFLIKVLLINWQWGEKYFAQTLIDYCPSLNNGNWQWSSGSGADAQPYFRVFNPWLQGEKHDKDAEYIKKWVPELKDVPAEHIHKWNVYCKKYDVDYPEPMVDYDEQKKKSVKMYAKIFK